MEYQSVLTTCPYCAVGCNLVFQVLDGRIIGTLPAKTGPTNEGSLCIKGWNVHEFVQHQDRLLSPTIRQDGVAPGSLLGCGPGSRRGGVAPD